MDYQEDEYLMLSGIQHFAFCRRQWALIHIEQQWEDNVRTVEGELMHKRAHDISLIEKSKDVLRCQSAQRKWVCLESVTLWSFEKQKREFNYMVTGVIIKCIQ